MPLALFSSRSLKSHTSSRRSLRRAAGLGLGFLSLLSVSAAHAGTVNWDNTAGDWFANPTHWSNGSTPGAGDDAVNSSTAAMTLGQSTTVNSFFSNGAFSLQGGTFSGNQANSLSAITVNSVFTVDGGQINNFTVNQGSGGSLVFTGSGGNSINNSIINSSMDLATNEGAFVRLYGTDTVNGTISLGTYNTNDGYGLRLSDGGNLIIGSGGALQGFGNVSQENAAGTLTNNGLVNANSSAGNTLTMDQTNFINNGTAEATNGGVLSLNNTTNNNGFVKSTGAGSSVGITGTFTGTGNSTTNLITASGGGAVDINGASLLGTINTDPNTSLVLNGSGNNNLSGTTVNGNLDLATNEGAFVRLYGTDTVNGTISLGTYNANDGYGLRLSDGGNLTLGSGSVLQGFGNVSQENAAGTLTNNGLVNANSSVGNALTMDQTNFVNSSGATAEATGGGILNLNNTTTNSGTLNALSGGVVNITGTFTSNAGNTIDGAGGTVNINGASLLGTINEASGTSLVLNSSGNNNLSGTTVNGNLDLATNEGAFVRLYGTDTVNGTISLGTYNTNDGYGLRLSDGGNLTLGSGSVLQGFGNVSQENAAGTLTNNGLVNANSSAGNTLTMDQTNFVNNGTAEATGGGILSLNNNTTNDGALTATGTGSSVGITGTFTGGGSNLITASGGGAVDINGASLLGTINTDPNTSLVLNGSGSNNLSGTTVNGNLDLATNEGAFVRLYGTDTVNGTISLATYNANDGYGLRLSDGGNLIIGSGGALQGFGNVSQENAAGTLTNNGLVNANSSVGNTLTMDQTNFINNGTTEVQNGAALNIAGNTTTTDSGNILVKTGGTATFGNPNLTQTAGLTQVDGTLNASPTLTGGTLAGTGTVVGNVANTGGTVSAGNSTSPFGTLAVSGSFTQGAGGTLDASFSSTQNNLLAVAGAVTTGGVLDVNYLGSGPYTGSGPFTFLDYTTLMTSIASTGPTQYFSNEMFLADGTGVIDGSNGFTYALLNDTTNNGLQLEVLNNGAPVPEASTTISLGLLLLLGAGGMAFAAKRKKVSASA